MYVPIPIRIYCKEVLASFPWSLGPAKVPSCTQANRDVTDTKNSKNPICDIGYEIVEVQFKNNRL